MVPKVVICLCLVLLSLQSIAGAPHTSRREQDLEKSFIEFLQQDKELSSLLEKTNLGSSAVLSRNLRQTDIDQDISGEPQDADGEKSKEGFFDRAARFVMEVLQRFLKWINTDN